MYLRGVFVRNCAHVSQHVFAINVISRIRSAIAYLHYSVKSVLSQVCYFGTRHAFLYIVGYKCYASHSCTLQWRHFCLQKVRSTSGVWMRVAGLAALYFAFAPWKIHFRNEVQCPQRITFRYLKSRFKENVAKIGNRASRILVVDRSTFIYDYKYGDEDWRTINYILGSPDVPSRARTRSNVYSASRQTFWFFSNKSMSYGHRWTCQDLPGASA